MAQKVTTASSAAGLMPGTSSGQATVVQEFSVRVPKPDRPMSVMKFNGALNVDISKWASLKMIREDFLKSSSSGSSNPKVEPASDQPEMPKFGAGSEYGREAREEARRRKYGQHKKKVNAEDHPWVIKSVTGDKQTKRFRGVREGTISSNASYFIFTQATDGQFEVFPVSHWYNFTPIQTYKALSAEEAEEEFGRRNKILNYFSVMVRKRMKGDEAEGGEKDEEVGRKRVSGGGLKVSEMEDWDDMNISESDDDEEKDEKEKPKKKKKGGAGKGKKKQKGSDSEANEDSDDGDEEGREVDYISDTSISESEDEEGDKKVELGGVDQESGLRNLLESESSEEENAEEKKEDKEEEGDKEAEKTKKKKVTKKKKKPNEMQPVESLSDESEDEEPEGANNDSDSSVKSSSLPEKEAATAPSGEADDSEGRKRKAAKAAGSPTAKKPKMEVSPALLQLAASEGITEEAVRRYLLRKPMTVTELLQKFKSKKTKVSSEDMVTIIASILKKINPTKRMQNSKMYLYLKN